MKKSIGRTGLALFVLAAAGFFLLPALHFETRPAGPYVVVALAGIGIVMLAIEVLRG